MSKLEYNLTPTYLGELEIDDIGQCALKCTSAADLLYYIAVRTVLGRTTIATCGPIDEYSDNLPRNVNITFTRMDYDLHKLENAIDKFINNSRTSIKEVEIVDYTEALNQFTNIQKYLLQGGE